MWYYTEAGIFYCLVSSLTEKKKKKRLTTGEKCADDLVIQCGKIAVILQNCKFSEVVLGLIVAAFITAKPHIPGGTT